MNHSIRLTRRKIVLIQFRHLQDSLFLRQIQLFRNHLNKIHNQFKRKLLGFEMTRGKLNKMVYKYIKFFWSKDYLRNLRKNKYRIIWVIKHYKNPRKWKRILQKKICFRICLQTWNMKCQPPFKISSKRKNFIIVKIYHLSQTVILLMTIFILHNWKKDHPRNCRPKNY